MLISGIGSEKVNRIDEDKSPRKRKRKKNKNTGYFKKQCLPAKTSGGTKQQPAEPCTAAG